MKAAIDHPFERRTHSAPSATVPDPMVASPATNQAEEAAKKAIAVLLEVAQDATQEAKDRITAANSIIAAHMMLNR